MEKISLVLENGARFTFSGRLFSEAVWEDEASGVLTHHKLYVTDQSNHVYVVIKRSRGRQLVHAYRVAVKGGRCVIFDGKQNLELPVSLLLAAADRVCGADVHALDQAKEMLLAAGS